MSPDPRKTSSECKGWCWNADQHLLRGKVHWRVAMPCGFSKRSWPSSATSATDHWRSRHLKSRQVANDFASMTSGYPSGHACRDSASWPMDWVVTKRWRTTGTFIQRTACARAVDTNFLDTKARLTTWKNAVFSNAA